MNLAPLSFQEDRTWDFQESLMGGGLSVQAPTAVLEVLDDSSPPAPEVDEENTPRPVPQTQKPANRRPSSERRHLAGADWLADWTLYFPAGRRGSETNADEKTSA